MPANKKITDQIAEDIRAKYQTGDFTQADLSTLFNVSVPTINKVVKGVKPPKRKYTHRTSKFAERNAEIVRLYNDEGMTMRDIAEKMDTTHQNVSLILNKQGVDPQARYFKQLAAQKKERQAEKKAERAAKKEAKEAKVQELSELWKTGASIESVRAAAGLKSTGAAQVKLVHLRKKYGEEMFPKRSAFGMSAEKQAERKAERDAKAAVLSELWKANADPAEMAAVFGWKEKAVTRRIPKLRAEYGEEMFPYRRKPRVKDTVQEPDEEVEFTA